MAGPSIRKAGLCVLLTGPRDAATTTIAREAARELGRDGHAVVVIDEPEIATHLDGADPTGALAWLCRMLVTAGTVVLVAHSPSDRGGRDRVRAEVPGCVEVLVDAPVADITSVDDEYEEPLGAELRLPTRDRRARDSAAQLVSWLEEQGLARDGL